MNNQYPTLVRVSTLLFSTAAVLVGRYWSRRAAPQRLTRLLMLILAVILTASAPLLWVAYTLHTAWPAMGAVAALGWWAVAAACVFGWSSVSGHRVGQNGGR